MKYLIYLSIFFISFKIHSQNEKLLPESIKLKKTYNELLNDSNNSSLQEKYITEFPDNAITFKKVFDSPTFNQLYNDSHLYIFKLSELSQNHPKLVGEKLIKLCFELKVWNADATSYIQHETMIYANKYFNEFVGLSKKLNNENLKSLITFLTDVENFNSYHDYENFTKKLKLNNESNLLVLFEKSRKKRINENKDQ